MTTDRTLYVFPISHYSEKTRWCLDAKGLAYTERPMMAGPHELVLRWMHAGRTVPVLVDQGEVVPDSTAIALHLEKKHPERSLLPDDAAGRARALELEEYFDVEAGPAVRNWVWGQMVDAPGNAGDALLGRLGLPGAVVRLADPVLSALVRRRFRLTPEKVARAREKLMAVLDRLEKEIDNDPERYLVGAKLSLADVTAASLLGPLVGPPGSPWADGVRPVEPPASLRDLRAAVRARPAGRWVLARYAHDRGRRAEA